jgi:hypothetical protein
MKKLILVLAGALALAGCKAEIPPVGSPADLPVLAPVCTAISSEKFDTALKAYGAATDAINLLVTAKVLVPGTAKARAVATANDKVLAAFAVAERARRACNATSYVAALGEAQGAIDEVRVALRR